MTEKRNKDRRKNTPPIFLIENIAPRLDCGRYPVKRTAGEVFVVEADVLRDGHEVVRASLRWRHPGQKKFSEIPMISVGNDRWRGEFPLPEIGRYAYTIAAWTDRFATCVADIRKRVEAGQPDLGSELGECARIIGEVRKRARGEKETLNLALRALSEEEKRPWEALKILLDPRLQQVMADLDPRDDMLVLEPHLEVVVNRGRALFGSWYEIFIRSQGTAPGVTGTFRDAERRLPGIREMGFDVIYLAPIHPIGKTGRKGPDNTLNARPEDPGSPWAIGSEAGGHEAVEPSIGTLADFDRFVRAAEKEGLEVALDFAIQCSPDHPWVKSHPEWFYRRPDGTIKYAENPPKKYEDIFPLNFDTEDREGLWRALLKTVLFWVNRGVRIFRVDNPHTKPFIFWEWLIGEVQKKHPDVIFLAEAFTRPKIMKALAKCGFTQSYTYFTWRNSKAEFIDYLTELASDPMREFFRPNFFANTPDILPEILQRGGRPAFKMRLALAATLSPSYGIYSGYELCENQAIPGTEEYLHSEKYEIKVRDWHAPGNIRDYVARLNAIRRENAALQQLANISFVSSDNDQILAYVKSTPNKSNVILVAVNMDPHHTQECTVLIPSDLVGVPAGATYQVQDLVTGESYAWGERNFVRLDPEREPAHILRLER